MRHTWKRSKISKNIPRAKSDTPALNLQMYFEFVSIHISPCIHTRIDQNKNTFVGSKIFLPHINFCVRKYICLHIDFPQKWAAGGSTVEWSGTLQVIIHIICFWSDGNEILEQN